VFFERDTEQFDDYVSAQERAQEWAEEITEESGFNVEVVDGGEW
jgi:broad specificity phosphatase PhoE